MTGDAIRVKAARKGAATRKRLKAARLPAAPLSPVPGSQIDRVAQGEQIAAMVRRIEEAVAARRALLRVRASTGSGPADA